MLIAWVVVCALFLIAMGIWTGVAVFLAGLLGYWFQFHGDMWYQAGQTIWGMFDSYDFITIPFFLLIGELLGGSKATKDFYALLTRLRSVRGMPALAAVALGAVPAVHGTVAAVTAVVSRTSYAHLQDGGFPRRQASGLVTSVGVLGILIPPSLTLIIYGTLTQTSITDLFQAGLVPGAIETLEFALISLYIWSRRVPRYRPEDAANTSTNASRSVTAAWQLPAVILIVLGGILTNRLNPVQAGAVGDAFTLLLLVINREASVSGLWNSFIRALSLTAMIMLIIAGAQMMANVAAFEGLAPNLLSLIQQVGISRLALFPILAALYLTLGAVFDGLSMMILTMPFIFPLVASIHQTPVWFGIITVVLVQLAEIAPPIGLNLFVAQQVTGDTLEEIWAGVIPYLIAVLALLALLFADPRLATF